MINLYPTIIVWWYTSWEFWKNWEYVWNSLRYVKVQGFSVNFAIVSSKLKQRGSADVAGEATWTLREL